MNNQKPEPVIARSSGIYDFHSIFHTIQGEGPFAGKRAIFVRLAGCNLQCPMCDTEYTSDRRYTTQKILELIEELHAEHGTRLIVITGGEPFRQDLNPLLLSLMMHPAVFTAQIETNGTLSPYRNTETARSLKILLESKRVTTVCSPKHPTINADLTTVVNAWKYVVNWQNVNAADGLPTLVLGLRTKREVGRPINNAEVFIQPEDGKDDHDNTMNMDAAVRGALAHGYTLCLQLHKYAGLA